MGRAYWQPPASARSFSSACQSPPLVSPSARRCSQQVLQLPGLPQKASSTLLASKDSGFGLKEKVSPPVPTINVSAVRPRATDLNATNPHHCRLLCLEVQLLTEIGL